MRVLAAAAALVLLPLAAPAQPQPPDGQPPALGQQQAEQRGGPVAQGCLKDLQALRHVEGAPGKGQSDSLSGGGAVRQELRALYQAARVLAMRGDDEGCRMILGRMRDIGGPTPQGAAREEATGRDVAAAQPLQSVEGLVRGQTLIGSQVRNRNDQLLGEVADVVIDPQDSQVAYVLMSRGGFFGLGEKVVAVPFGRLEATADPNLYVLDVPEDRFARAPAFATGELDQLAARHRQVDDYWD